MVWGVGDCANRLFYDGFLCTVCCGDRTVCGLIRSYAYYDYQSSYSEVFKSLRRTVRWAKEGHLYKRLHRMSLGGLIVCGCRTNRTGVFYGKYVAK